MARSPQESRLDRGTTAPSGASDISVYGATPIALGAPALAMTLGGAPAPAESPAVGSSATSAASNGALAEGGSPLAMALAAPVMLVDAATIAMTSLAVPSTPNDAAPTAEADAKPVGGGDGVGVPPGLQPSTATVPAEMAAGSGAPSATGVSTDDATQQSFAEPPPIVTEAAMAAMAERIAAMEERVETIVTGIDDRLSEAGERVESLATGIDNQLPGTLTDIGDRVDDITGGVTAQLVGIAADLGDRVAAAGETIDETVGGLTITVGNQIGGLTEALGDTLADIDLGPVGGADPAGGITTLVGMVSAADAFGLQDIGGATDALALPTGLGNGDPLGDFAPADVLLNVPDIHDGAFGLLAGLTDDHFG